MPRIAGVDIPSDKPIWISLTYLYGIGPTNSRVILKEAGIEFQRRAKDLSEEELASRTKELMANDAPSPGDASPAVDERIVQYLRNGDSPRRDVAHPRFAPGNRVRISNVPAAAHTRLPGCLRARVGTNDAPQKHAQAATSLGWEM